MGSDAIHIESYSILLSQPTKQTSFDICFCFAVFLQINKNKQKPLLLFLCILFEVSQKWQFCWVCCQNSRFAKSSISHVTC